MRVLIILGLVAWLAAGCNTAKDTADTAKSGSGKAVGIAEKMKGGTVGEGESDSGGE
jgi:hypothetical protein